MAIDKKKWMRWVSVALVLFLGVWSSLFAQLECERTLPDDFSSLTYPLNEWDAYVFQLSPGYRADVDRNDMRFLHASANRVYKGYLLRDNNQFLPSGSLNFNTVFSVEGGTDQDTNIFPTGSTPDGPADGCGVLASHFGIIMRSRFIVQESGIYRVRVGSDDGSYMRMFKREPGDVLLRDVNDRPLIHNNWVKLPDDPAVFDGYYNFLYEDNIRDYFVYLTQGEEVYIDLNYYEKTNVNRLAFNMEIYFGGGQILMNNVLQTDEYTYCAVIPDPDPFYSNVSAVLNDGEIDEHQWEYSLDGVNWNEIPGATGPAYDIPAYDPSTGNWTGTRYFRRRAEGELMVEGELINETVYSNTLAVTVSAIDYPSIDPASNFGLSEYGSGKWNVFLYKGEARNQAAYFENNRERFLGKHTVGGTDDLNITALFRNAGIRFSPNQFGCHFFPGYFSAQLLREEEIQPGTYTFTITADDGYRLFINDELVTPLTNMPIGTSVNPWNRAGAAGNPNNPQPGAPFNVYTFEVPERGTYRFRIEYYELAGGQELNFFSDLSLLPVEWGNISGDACGPENCLNWETVQEKNSSHFVVERSTDAREWTPVGEPVQAQGMSTQLTKYAFKDGAFLSERSYYRIRQVDLDGSVSYSDIIRVDNRNTARQMAPYPNPTTDRLRFYSQSEVKLVHLSSADTRIMHSLPFTEVGPQIFEVDLSSYSNSFYVISVITNGSRQSYKVVKR